MLRTPWMMSVAPLLGLLAASPAAADAPVSTCASDDECRVGMFCDRGGTGTEIPTPANAQVAHCAFLPQGYCESQGDCSDGLVCSKYSNWDGCNDIAAYDASMPFPGQQDGGSARPSEPRFAKAAPIVAAAPFRGGQDACVPREVVDRYGRCELPVTACESDAQCLAGLSCVNSGWGGGYADAGTSVGADAGHPDHPTASSGAAEASPVGDIPVDSGGYEGGVGYADASWGDASWGDAASGSPSSECSFSETPCQATADCAGGYECARVHEGTACGGSVACDADGGCPPPTEPVCEDFYKQLCYPKQAVCNTDAECAGGWKCIEFTNAEGGLTSPSWWNATQAVKSCVPAGFAVLAGSARGLPWAPRQVSSFPEGLGPVAEGGPTAGGPRGDDGQDAGVSNPGTDPKPGVGESDGSSKDSGICSVGFVGGSPTSGLGLLTGLLGLVIRRRRRA